MINFCKFITSNNNFAIVHLSLLAHKSRNVTIAAQLLNGNNLFPMKTLGRCIQLVNIIRFYHQLIFLVMYINSHIVLKNRNESILECKVSDSNNVSKISNSICYCGPYISCLNNNVIGYKIYPGKIITLSLKTSSAFRIPVYVTSGKLTNSSPSPRGVTSSTSYQLCVSTVHQYNVHH